MNVKRFLSDSYRRSLDHKIGKLVINHQVNKVHKWDLLPPMEENPKPNSQQNLLRNNSSITIYHALDIYKEKCRDLGLKPNPYGEKRFVEQFMNSVMKKSLRFTGLGLGPGCAKILIDVLYNNPQYVFIDLSLNKFKDDGAKMLARYVTLNPPLIYLDLRSNRIGIEGCTNIFNSIKCNTHLTNLDLSAIDGIERNRIGSEGSRALASVLSTNQALSSLNLAMCGITAEGCIHIGKALAKNTTLTYLDLTANRFGSPGANALFGHPKSFGNLETLILSRNAIDDDAARVICKQIKKSPELRIIDLSFNSLSHTFLNLLYSAFHKYTALTSLNLAGNGFGPEHNEGVHLLIRDFPSIVHYDFSKNPLKHNALINIAKSIKARRNILSIDLTETQMDDTAAIEFADLIKSHPSLQKISFAENGLTDASGVLIAQAIGENNVLSNISLRNNELNNKTAAALLKALEKNNTIVDIDISFNDFSFNAHIQLNRTIEEHKRSINSNISDIAQKHIDVLKKKELQLFKTRDEIKQLQEEVANATNTRLSTNEYYEKFKLEKQKEIEDAEKELDDLKNQRDEIQETKRLKTREFNAKKQALDKRQQEALANLQNLSTTKQAVQSRLTRLESKRLEMKVKTSKEQDDYKMKIDELAQQLRAAIDDVLTAKMLMLDKEREEAAALQEANGVGKAGKAGKPGKNAKNAKKGKKKKGKK